jgi:hypothetical protein
MMNRYGQLVRAQYMKNRSELIESEEIPKREESDSKNMTTCPEY